MAPPTSSQIKPGRTLLVLLAIILAMGATIALQKAFVPKFGLDLAGGTTVTLSPVTTDGKAPPQESLDRAVNIIRDRVNGTGISDAEVARSGDNIVISVPGAGRDEAIKLVATTAEMRFRQVLAVAAATTPPTTLPTTAATPSPSAVTPSTGTSPAGRALSKALAEPTPTPTVTRRARSHTATGEKTGAGTRAKATPSPTPSVTPSEEDPLAGQDLSGIDPAMLQKFRTIDCTAKNRGQGAQDDPNKQIVACSQDGSARYILDKAAVQGSQITTASSGVRQDTGEWVVNLDFKSQGASQWSDLTAKAFGAQQPRNQIGVVLDGLVITAPASNGRIPGGKTEISGSFNQQSATELADQLKYGALPLKFVQSSVVSVSSTLGQDQLRGGLVSGAIGLLIVMLYLLLYYRGLGAIGIASLGIATIVTYFSVAVLSANVGFRWSLPHIIGLVVSIGITADSFIVYFERIRDEMKEGHRTLRAAVEVAWRRAKRTILVADAVMFIAAVVLYFLAVGGVAGFAFAMGLTTLIDIIVVFLFTKPLMSLAARMKFFSKGHKLSGLDAERMGRTNSGAEHLQEA
ncbi:protein translocase subunit SecD [Microtetraspora sp. AC03309]|uniref:protein translocase subunit SecD n=1 Tax=Microtetraspora sp. AC03309 TaxID=2779376 RepID=UPI0027E18A70|nr:protein translocase subunit SecD [Microtetraspora sp. AC03309]